MVEAAAAEFLRDVGSVEAEGADLVLDLPAEFSWHQGRALDLVLERIELPLDEAPHGIDHHPLFLAQSKLHGSLVRFIGGRT